MGFLRTQTDRSIYGSIDQFSKNSEDVKCLLFILVGKRLFIVKWLWPVMANLYFLLAVGVMNRTHVGIVGEIR